MNEYLQKESLRSQTALEVFTGVEPVCHMCAEFAQ